MPAPSAQLVGFLRHLRHNGFAAGLPEARDAARFLAAAGPGPGPQVLRPLRLGLRSLLARDHGQWDRFDALFDAWWLGRGERRAQTLVPIAGQPRRPELWSRILPREGGAMGEGGGIPVDPDAPEGEAPQSEGGKGRMVASRRGVVARADLRHLSTPAEVAEAERVALRLAAAMRYRLSRRRIAARRGAGLDLRRTIRRSLGQGGELLELVQRRRPERPVRIVVLLDVSGSMQVYSRYFLLFLRGLVGGWLRADGYLFHTRLVRVTAALRDRNSDRALAQLALMAEGFGGGTRIAAALCAFNDRHAKAAIDSRTVVLLLSDGYDTDPPEALARELARLKRRARRLVWLNPLLGWRDYAPVARGMAAAMPYLDAFAAANTLESLAALEAEFARI